MSDPQQYPPSPAAPAPQVYPATATTAPSATRAGLARVAFACAVVSVALGLFSSLLTRFLLVQMVYRLHLSTSMITVYNLATQVILLLAYAATLILGVMAARGERKLLAGIAIGIGAAGTLSTLVALFATAIAPLLV